MKFSDNIERTSLEEVFVIRTTEDMHSREEASSDLWDYLKGMGNDYNLYSTPVRDVKIGESIYNSEGNYVAYRTE